MLISDPTQTKNKQEISNQKHRDKNDIKQKTYAPHPIEYCFL